MQFMSVNEDGVSPPRHVNLKEGIRIQELSGILIEEEY